MRDGDVAWKIMNGRNNLKSMSMSMSLPCSLRKHNDVEKPGDHSRTSSTRREAASYKQLQLRLLHLELATTASMVCLFVSIRMA